MNALDPLYHLRERQMWRDQNKHMNVIRRTPLLNMDTQFLTGLTNNGTNSLSSGRVILCADILSPKRCDRCDTSIKPVMVTCRIYIKIQNFLTHNFA